MHFINRWKYEYGSYKSALEYNNSSYKSKKIKYNNASYIGGLWSVIITMQVISSMASELWGYKQYELGSMARIHGIKLWFYG